MLFWRGVWRLSNLRKSDDGAGKHRPAIAGGPRPPELSPYAQPPAVVDRRLLGMERRDQTICRPAHRSEIDSALRMILGTAGRLADDSQLADFLSYALHRGIDVNDIRVAESHGRIVWATLPVVSPGRTMLLLAPQTASDPVTAAAAIELIELVIQIYRRSGVYLAQVLFDPASTELAHVFATAGFEKLAELVYLHRKLGRGAISKPPVMPLGFAWETYSPAAHGRFAQTILKTYEQSLDCPALNGMRDIQDVMLGHKAAGDFDPGWWFLLTEAGEPRGVLLLSRAQHADSAELVYLGLTPEARGRGLAPLVLQQATSFTTQAGCGLLSLAVDAGNARALKLYYRIGMQQVTSRIAMVRSLQSTTTNERAPALAPVTITGVEHH